MLSETTRVFNSRAVVGASAAALDHPQQQLPHAYITTADSSSAVHSSNTVTASPTHSMSGSQQSDSAAGTVPDSGELQVAAITARAHLPDCMALVPTWSKGGGDYCLNLAQPDKAQLSHAIIADTIAALPVPPSEVTNVRGPVLEIHRADGHSVDVKIVHSFRAQYAEPIDEIRAKARAELQRRHAATRAAAAADAAAMLQQQLGKQQQQQHLPRDPQRQHVRQGSGPQHTVCTELRADEEQLLPDTIRRTSSCFVHEHDPSSGTDYQQSSYQASSTAAGTLSNASSLQPSSQDSSLLHTAPQSLDAVSADGWHSATVGGNGHAAAQSLLAAADLPFAAAQSPFATSASQSAAGEPAGIPGQHIRQAATGGSSEQWQQMPPLPVAEKSRRHSHWQQQRHQQHHRHGGQASHGGQRLSIEVMQAYGANASSSTGAPPTMATQPSFIEDGDAIEHSDSQPGSSHAVFKQHQQHRHAKHIHWASPQQQHQQVADLQGELQEQHHQQHHHVGWQEQQQVHESSNDLSATLAKQPTTAVFPAPTSAGEPPERHVLVTMTKRKTAHGHKEIQIEPVHEGPAADRLNNEEQQPQQQEPEQEQHQVAAWTAYGPGDNVMDLNVVQPPADFAPLSGNQRDVGAAAASHSHHMADGKHAQHHAAIVVGRPSSADADKHFFLGPPMRTVSGSFMPCCEWELDPRKVLVGRRLAVGGFAEVFLGKYEGTVVAIKRLLTNDALIMERFVSEVRMLARLRHPNLILFMGYCTMPELCIVTEFMSKGSLYSVLHAPEQRKHRHLLAKQQQEQPMQQLSGHLNFLEQQQQYQPEVLDPKLQRLVAISVARAMFYLHTRNPPILHLDLKSPNILVDDRWRVKVTDFGLSRARQRTFVSSSAQGGTPEWMTPEVLRCEQVAEPADAYSYGVMLWELITGRCPWDNYNPMQVVAIVGFRGMSLPLPTTAEDPFLLELCKRCMHRNPAIRPTFPQIVALLDQHYGPPAWAGSAQPLLPSTPRPAQLPPAVPGLLLTAPAATSTDNSHVEAAAADNGAAIPATLASDKNYESGVSGFCLQDEQGKSHDSSTVGVSLQQHGSQQEQQQLQAGDKQSQFVLPPQQQAQQAGHSQASMDMSTQAGNATVTTPLALSSLEQPAADKDFVAASSASVRAASPFVAQMASWSVKSAQTVKQQKANQQAALPARDEVAGSSTETAGAQTASPFAAHTASWSVALVQNARLHQAAQQTTAPVPGQGTSTANAPVRATSPFAAHTVPWSLASVRSDREQQPAPLTAQPVSNQAASSDATATAAVRPASPFAAHMAPWSVESLQSMQEEQAAQQIAAERMCNDVASGTCNAVRLLSPVAAQMALWSVQSISQGQATQQIAQMSTSQIGGSSSSNPAAMPQVSPFAGQLTPWSVESVRTVQEADTGCNAAAPRRTAASSTTAGSSTGSDHSSLPGSSSGTWVHSSGNRTLPVSLNAANIAATAAEPQGAEPVTFGAAVNISCRSQHQSFGQHTPGAEEPERPAAPGTQCLPSRQPAAASEAAGSTPVIGSPAGGTLLKPGVECMLTPAKVGAGQAASKAAVRTPTPAPMDGSGADASTASTTWAPLSGSTDTGARKVPAAAAAVDSLLIQQLKPHLEVYLKAAAAAGLAGPAAAAGMPAAPHGPDSSKGQEHDALQQQGQAAWQALLDAAGSLAVLSGRLSSEGSSLLHSLWPSMTEGTLSGSWSRNSSSSICHGGSRRCPEIDRQDGCKDAPDRISCRQVGSTCSTGSMDGSNKGAVTSTGKAATLSSGYDCSLNNSQDTVRHQQQQQQQGNQPVYQMWPILLADSDAQLKRVDELPALLKLASPGKHEAAFCSNQHSAGLGGAKAATVAQDTKGVGFCTGDIQLTADTRGLQKGVRVQLFVDAGGGQIQESDCLMQQQQYYNHHQQQQQKVQLQPATSWKLLSQQPVQQQQKQQQPQRSPRDFGHSHSCERVMQQLQKPSRASSNYQNGRSVVSTTPSGTDCIREVETAATAKMHSVSRWIQQKDISQQECSQTDKPAAATKLWSAAEQAETLPSTGSAAAVPVPAEDTGAAAAALAAALAVSSAAQQVVTLSSNSIAAAVMPAPDAVAAGAAPSAAAAATAAATSEADGSLDIMSAFACPSNSSLAAMDADSDQALSACPALPYSDADDIEQQSSCSPQSYRLPMTLSAPALPTLQHTSGFGGGVSPVAHVHSAQQQLPAAVLYWGTQVSRLQSTKSELLLPSTSCSSTLPARYPAGQAVKVSGSTLQQQQGQQQQQTKRATAAGGKALEFGSSTNSKAGSKLGPAVHRLTVDQLTKVTSTEGLTYKAGRFSVNVKQQLQQQDKALQRRQSDGDGTISTVFKLCNTVSPPTAIAASGACGSLQTYHVCGAAATAAAGGGVPQRPTDLFYTSVGSGSLPMLLQQQQQPGCNPPMQQQLWVPLVLMQSPVQGLLQGNFSGSSGGGAASDNSHQLLGGQLINSSMLGNEPSNTVLPGLAAQQQQQVLKTAVGPPAGTAAASQGVLGQQLQQGPGSPLHQWRHLAPLAMPAPAAGSTAILQSPVPLPFLQQQQQQAGACPAITLCVSRAGSHCSSSSNLSPSDPAGKPPLAPQGSQACRTPSPANTPCASQVHQPRGAAVPRDYCKGRFQVHESPLAVGKGSSSCSSGGSSIAVAAAGGAATGTIIAPASATAAGKMHTMECRAPTAAAGSATQFHTLVDEFAGGSGSIGVPAATGKYGVPPATLQQQQAREQVAVTLPVMQHSNSVQTQTDTAGSTATDGAAAVPVKVGQFTVCTKAQAGAAPAATPAAAMGGSSAVVGEGNYMAGSRSSTMQPSSANSSTGNDNSNFIGTNNKQQLECADASLRPVQSAPLPSAATAAPISHGGACDIELGAHLAPIKTVSQRGRFVVTQATPASTASSTPVSGSMAPTLLVPAAITSGSGGLMAAAAVPATAAAARAAVDSGVSDAGVPADTSASAAAAWLYSTPAASSSSGDTASAVSDAVENGTLVACPVCSAPHTMPPPPAVVYCAAAAASITAADGLSPGGSQCNSSSNAAAPCNVLLHTCSSCGAQLPPLSPLPPALSGNAAATTGTAAALWGVSGIDMQQIGAQLQQPAAVTLGSSAAKTHPVAVVAPRLPAVATSRVLEGQQQQTAPAVSCGSAKAQTPTLIGPTGLKLEIAAHYTGAAMQLPVPVLQTAWQLPVSYPL